MKITTSIVALFLLLLGASPILRADPVQIRVDEGHADQVLSIAGSDDLKILITGGNDQKLVVWDKNSYRQVKSIKLPGTPIKILPTSDKYTFQVALSDWSIIEVNINSAVVRQCYMQRDWIDVGPSNLRQTIIVKNNGAIGSLDSNCRYEEILPEQKREFPRGASLYKDKVFVLFDGAVEKIDIKEIKSFGRFVIPDDGRYNHIESLSEDTFMLGSDANKISMSFDKRYLQPRLGDVYIGRIESEGLREIFKDNIVGGVAGAMLTAGGNVMFVGLMGGICGARYDATDSTMYKLALCDIKNRTIVKAVRSGIYARSSRKDRETNSANSYFVNGKEIFVAGYREYSIYGYPDFEERGKAVSWSSFIGFSRIGNDHIILSGNNLYSYAYSDNGYFSRLARIMSNDEILSACYKEGDLVYSFGKGLYTNSDHKAFAGSPVAKITSLQCNPGGIYFSDEMGGVYFFDSALSIVKDIKSAYLDEFSGVYIKTALLDNGSFLSWIDFEKKNLFGGMDGMGVLSKNLQRAEVRREFNLKNNPERNAGVVTEFAEYSSSPGQIAVALYDEGKNRSNIYGGFMHAGFDDKRYKYQPKLLAEVEGRVNSICSHSSGTLFLASAGGFYVIHSDRTARAGEGANRLEEGNFTTVSCLENRVVTTNTSGAIVFRDAGGKTLYSYYVGVDGEWILQIPDGYFAYSHPSMLRRISVISGLTSSSINQFHDVFYRPDIVRAKLRGEDIMPLVGDLTIEKALRNPPPRVDISSVPGNTSSARINVPYTITPDTGGVAEVRIFQNGKLVSSDGTYKDAPRKTYAPVAGKSLDAGRYAEANLQRNATRVEASKDKTNTLRDQLIVRGAPEKKCTPGKAGDPCKGEIDVEVIPGEENTITVVAFNRDNTIQSVPASVSFKSTLPKEDPHLWVVGVGIDQFAGISSLRNAHKDALDFICTYAGKDQVSQLGVACAEDGKAKTLFKPENIHVVDALFDTQATKSNILAALDKVAKQAKPGDTFVWFVASHGMMDANSNFGIVAHDTQCLNDNCTDIKGHLTSNEILEASKKIKAMKQLVVLDTCHSGGLDSKLSGLYDARVSLLAKNMGLHLYASAQATEAAQDGKPGTNGTFTAQLLEGIKGAAPKNPEGQISVMTLGDYAKQKTVEATQPKSGAKDARPAQTPVIQHFGQDAGLVGGK